MTDLLARLQTALGDAYRIEKELGGGGMSRLFLATEASLHRPVVIKLLPPEFASEVSAARFKQEIELAAHLQHPNILPVLTAGAKGDLLFYVMPFVSGESLRHRLTREGKLPVADTVRILHEVADALAHAHAEGVIHRDIKPENILLEGGYAVLTDFGVARALVESQSGGRLTDTGLAVGTPGYMSPEQAAGERHIDARADVYALAVVGYEMLAGYPPFSGPTAPALLAAHLTVTPKPVADVRPDTPPGVSNAIARALAKDPNVRLRTAAEFRDALGAPHGGAARRRLSKRWQLAASIVLVAAMVSAAVLIARSRARPALDPNLLAVAPFDVLDPKLELWHEGLVDVLSRNLDGAGPLRTVSPTVVVRRWSGRADPTSASELGHRTGARLAVFGQLVTASADSVRLTATLFDVASSRPLGEIELREASARMDRLADSATVALLRELGRTRPIGAVRLASLGSTSLPALKAFLQGEQYFRRTAWDSAIANYQRAIALDSTFALALRRVSVALGWQRVGTDSLSRVYALRAGAFNRGLPPRESLLVTADSLSSVMYAYVGDTAWFSHARRLFGTLEEAVRRYPEDPEVWYSLGDARYHFGFAANTEQQILDAFKRSIALDSAFAPAYLHPVELGLNLGGAAEGRRYAAAYLALGPTDVDAEEGSGCWQGCSTQRRRDRSKWRKRSIPSRRMPCSMRTSQSAGGRIPPRPRCGCCGSLPPAAGVPTVPSPTPRATGAAWRPSLRIGGSCAKHTVFKAVTIRCCWSSLRCWAESHPTPQRPSSGASRHRDSRCPGGPHGATRERSAASVESQIRPPARQTARCSGAWPATTQKRPRPISRSPGGTRPRRSAASRRCLIRCASGATWSGSSRRSYSRRAGGIVRRRCSWNGDSQPP